MTVRELMQVLLKYPLDADVKFDAITESRQMEMVFCRAAHGDSSVIIRLLEV